jgi:hypothetical protein
MKATLKKWIFAVLVCASIQVNAGTITQQFSSAWTVASWDYYGDVAAMQ